MSYSSSNLDDECWSTIPTKDPSLLSESESSRIEEEDTDEDTHTSENEDEAISTDSYSETPKEHSISQSVSLKSDESKPDPPFLIIRETPIKP